MSGEADGAGAEQRPGSQPDERDDGEAAAATRIAGPSQRRDAGGGVADAADGVGPAARMTVARVEARVADAHGESLQRRKKNAPSGRADGA